MFFFNYCYSWSHQLPSSKTVYSVSILLSNVCSSKKNWRTGLLLLTGARADNCRSHWQVVVFVILFFFFFSGPLGIHLKQCTCSPSDKICPKQLDHCILADSKYNGGVTSYFSLPLGLEADSFVRLLTLPFEDVEWCQACSTCTLLRWQDLHKTRAEHLMYMEIKDAILCCLHHNHRIDCRRI